VAKKGLGEARKLFRARRFSDVIRLLEPEVFRYRENFDYFKTLGFACLYAGDFGGAFSYMSRAHQLKDDDPDVVLGIAAVHFRRSEQENALKRWLEVVEARPGNRVAQRGLDLLRKGMTPDALQEFIDSGRLRTLFPPLPPRFSAGPVLAVVLGVMALAGISYLAAKFAAPRAAERPGVSVIEMPSDTTPLVDVGPGQAFTYTEGEVRRLFRNAKAELLGYRDNLAVVDINRILLSNAAPSVKERARLLKGFVTQPTFDTVRNTYTYADVRKQPLLYDGASVVWRGKVANLKSSRSAITFDLLVGYDQEKQLEGIVPVSLAFAADVGNGDAVDLLGQVAASPSSAAAGGASSSAPTASAPDGVAPVAARLSLVGISLHRISQ